MNQVVKFALLFLIMVGSVAARRPVVHDLFLAEDTSKEADAINKMNDYLQGIGADMEKRYSVGSVLQKHKLQDDYINLLEEGGRATALALAKGNREHETIVRESISNVEKLTQLIGAIGVVIGDNTKVEVQAGLSLGALGGGVSVGFAIKLGVIPDLLAVVNNFISLHYEETEDSTASMRFMHQLKQKLEEKAECKDVAKLLKARSHTAKSGIQLWNPNPSVFERARVHVHLGHRWPALPWWPPPIVRRVRRGRGAAADENERRDQVCLEGSR